MRPRIGAATVYAVLTIAPAALVAQQFGLLSTRTASAGPWTTPAPASATIDVGVTTLPLARNGWRPWTAKDLGTVNSVEQKIHKHLSIVMWYADWAHRDPLRAQLHAVGARGSVPEITWEPWDSLHDVTNQPRYRLSNIINGSFDGYIRSWAKTIAAYGKPVRLRFAQEMNGNWYPWSERVNGNHRGQFVRAWDHVHKVFDAAGATNVQWIWSIASVGVPAEALYPGPHEVDMVSMSVFNGGYELHFRPWRSFATLVAKRVKKLGQIAPKKPIEVSEIGCAAEGGSKPAWIHGLFSLLRRRPQIQSIIWYDLVKGSDWRIESSNSSAQAFRREVSNPRYR
jgi:Glycosyl hydrolase family 26